MTSASCSRPAAFQEAYEKFVQTIRPEDAKFFESLTLDDVENTALEIQDSQRKKRSLRNLRRIAPLFEGLRKYGKTIEVLCNQTPYLAFVWVGLVSSWKTAWVFLTSTQAPIGLMLQVRASIFLGRPHMLFSNMPSLVHSWLKTIHPSLTNSSLLMPKLPKCCRDLSNSKWPSKTDLISSISWPWCMQIFLSFTKRRIISFGDDVRYYCMCSMSMITC